MSTKQTVIIARPDRKSVTRTHTEERTVSTRADGTAFITVKGKRVSCVRDNEHVPYRVLLA